MKLFKKAKKGFTLVELIVVIAIVAILAAVSVAGYYGFIESAKQSRADQEAAQIKLVIQAATTPATQGAKYGADQKTELKHTYSFGKDGITVSKEAENNAKENLEADFALILAANGVLVNDNAGKQPTLKLVGDNNANYLLPTTGQSAADGWVKSIVYTSVEGKASTIDFTK